MLVEVALFGGYAAGLTGSVVVAFGAVAVWHRWSIARGARKREEPVFVCQHPATEFTPSTGQTRCRTCGELIWQDMPQS